MRKSKQVVPTDGMVITADTVLRPGVYALPKGISIAADGVTLDGSQALLLGHERQGRGLTLKSVKGVTVKNLRLAEFEHGIHANQCTDLEISGCQITSTAEVPHNTIFLDIWLPAKKAYGGGILLWEVNESRVIENDLSHQMNGLLTYNCRDLVVRGNLANYCIRFSTVPARPLRPAAAARRPPPRIGCSRPTRCPGRRP